MTALISWIWAQARAHLNVRSSREVRFNNFWAMTVLTSSLEVDSCKRILKHNLRAGSIRGVHTCLRTLHLNRLACTTQPREW